MSWWGSHSMITRAQAKELLPKGVCKLCLYWVRTHMTESRVDWARDPIECTRCGLKWSTRVVFEAAGERGWAKKDPPKPPNVICGKCGREHKGETGWYLRSMGLTVQEGTADEPRITQYDPLITALCPKCQPEWLWRLIARLGL